MYVFFLNKGGEEKFTPIVLLRIRTQGKIQRINEKKNVLKILRPFPNPKASRFQKMSIYTIEEDLHYKE